MKNLFEIFCYVVIIVCFSACRAEDDMLNWDVESAQTRAIVSECGVSTSNPDLIDNWENVSRIVLNTLGTDNKNKYVTAPWIDGSTSSLPENFRKDIKKEDGWRMLFHTFKEVGWDEKLNYICFYNQFTGFMKIFYYYEGENRSQGTQWFLMTSNGQNVTLLDEPTYLAKTSLDPASNNKLLFSNQVNSPTYGLDSGWNGFEFQISRYSQDLSDMDFIVGAYDKEIKDYNLLGKEYLSTVGTITTTSENSSGISKGLANLAGPEAKKFIDKLGGNLFGDKVILGKSIKDLIGSIPGSSYISAITSGLDLIFGKTTTTSSSEVNLTTTGTVEISGTSSSLVTAGVPPLSFDLYAILNPNCKTVANTKLVLASSVAMGEHHLGVWALKKNPTVYYERVVMMRNICQTSSGIGSIGIVGDVTIPEIKHYDFEPVINPDLLPYITRHSFSVKFILCDTLEGKNYSSNDINDVGLRKEYLYSDINNSFREIAEGLEHKMEVAANIDSDVPINTYGTIWYDWGNVINGKLLAVVSLHMNVSINGQESDIRHSQVYKVDYGIDDTLVQPQMIHNPPYVVVANYGWPYTARFGWTQNYN